MSNCFENQFFSFPFPPSLFPFLAYTFLSVNEALQAAGLEPTTSGPRGVYPTTVQQQLQHPPNVIVVFLYLLLLLTLFLSLSLSSSLILLFLSASVGGSK